MPDCLPSHSFGTCRLVQASISHCQCFAGRPGKKGTEPAASSSAADSSDKSVEMLLTAECTIDFSSAVWKAMSRKEKNRASAAASRARKEAYTESLEDKVGSCCFPSTFRTKHGLSVVLVVIQCTCGMSETVPNTMSCNLTCRCSTVSYCRTFFVSAVPLQQADITAQADVACHALQVRKLQEEHDWLQSQIEPGSVVAHPQESAAAQPNRPPIRHLSF